MTLQADDGIAAPKSARVGPAAAWRRIGGASPARTRVVDLVERVVLVAAVAFAIAANLASQRLLNVASIGNDLIVVFFVLIRRSATTVSESPLDWALAFGASLGVLLMRPGGTPLIGAIGTLALTLPGLIISLTAKLSLNRCFGVVAANRGVKASGVYRIVRHPMYLGYFLSHTAYLLLNPTALNLGVWLAVCGCQVGRVIREEQLLLRDPAYRAYAARVRHRVLPGLI